MNFFSGNLQVIVIYKSHIANHKLSTINKNRHEATNAVTNRHTINKISSIRLFKSKLSSVFMSVEKSTGRNVLQCSFSNKEDQIEDTITLRAHNCKWCVLFSYFKLFNSFLFFRLKFNIRNF